MAADMFHIGHLRLIKKAKSHGDYLIVGVHSDEDMESYKRKPIIPAEQRYEIIESCKYVDEIIKDAPLLMNKEFILKNNIDLIVRGDDVTPEHLEQQKDAIEMGIMRYVSRTPEISTSGIIDKIRSMK